ncbi:hypothetical protein BH11CYA1_BH11CYA1_46640 [soil metagenome]
MADFGIESPWLFTSTDDPDEHIKRIRAHVILSDAFAAAGVDGASSHSMRSYSESRIMPSRLVEILPGLELREIRSA